MDAIDLYLVVCVIAFALALPFLVDPRRPRDLERQQRRANLIANGYTPAEAERILRR
jgi:hypothetical protein